MTVAVDLTSALFFTARSTLEGALVGSLAATHDQTDVALRGCIQMSRNGVQGPPPMIARDRRTAEMQRVLSFTAAR